MWGRFGCLLGRGVLVLLFTLVAIPSSAQMVVNPTMVEFDPSPDHMSTLPNGQFTVSSYDLQFFLAGAAQPFQVNSLGKPVPAADGKIRANFAVIGARPTVTYETRVAATGPTGTGISASSNPFSFTGSGVYVTANGTHGSITLGAGQSLSIAVSFSAAQVVNPTEVYVGVATQSGNVTWLAPNSQRFVSTPAPVYSGPLGSFGPTVVVQYPNVSALAPGRYWWFVAIDNDSNGAPNAVWLDYAATIIR